MRKIGVVVIDDAPIERRTLTAQIALHPILFLLGEADGIASGVEIIRKERPEVVFLDICLGEKSGFDLLRALPEKPRVVFVTSSFHYGPEAFELDAVDYLVKPVASARFEATVRRLENLFSPGTVSAERHARNDRICLRAGSQTHLILVSRLVALQAEGNFTSVLCADGHSILVGRPIGEFDTMLPTPPFIRLDRSLIVNLERMERAERLSRDLSRLWLRGTDTPLELGRTATERLREIFNQTGLVPEIVNTHE